MPTVERILNAPEFERLPSEEQADVREWLRRRVIAHPKFQGLPPAEKEKVVSRILPRGMPVPGGAIEVAPGFLGRAMERRPPIPGLREAWTPLAMAEQGITEALPLVTRRPPPVGPGEPRSLSWVLPATGTPGGSVQIDPGMLAAFSAFPRILTALGIPLRSAYRAVRGRPVELGRQARRLVEPPYEPFLRRQEERATRTLIEDVLERVRVPRALSPGEPERLALPPGIDWARAAPTRRMLPPGPRELPGRVEVRPGLVEPEVLRRAPEAVQEGLARAPGDWRTQVLEEAERVLTGVATPGISQREGTRRLLEAAAQAIRGELTSVRRTRRAKLIPPWGRVLREQPTKPVAPVARPVAVAPPPPVEAPAAVLERTGFQEVADRLRQAEPPAATAQPPIPAPVKTRRVPTRPEPTDVNLADPRSIARYIVLSGRLKPSGGLEGEFQAIPWRFKSKTGRALDQVADEIARAQGRDPKEVEDALLGALSGGKISRRLQPIREVEHLRPPEDIPIPPQEWAEMSTLERRGVVEMFRMAPEEARPVEPGRAPVLQPEVPPMAARAVDDATRELARRDFAQKQFRPPMVGEDVYRAEWERLKAAELRVERTPSGDQGVIPGTPGRAMPPTALRGETPQRPLAETPLFGREAEFQAAQTELPRPTGPKWRSTTPPKGVLERWQSADRRFVADQTSPDTWRVQDQQTGATTTTATFQAARQWVTDRLGTVRGFVPPVPVPSPPEEERDTPQGRLQQVAQVLALGLPLLALLGRRRAPSIPRGTRPPSVPPQYRRETIRPPVPPRPPGLPGRGFAGGDPGPVPEIPEAAMGRWWRGTKSLYDESKLVGGNFYGTVLGQFERLGPYGKQISHAIQRAEADKHTWYGRHIDPLVRDLRRLTRPEEQNFIAVLEQGARPATEKVSRAVADYTRIFGPNGLIPQEAQARHLLIVRADRQAVPWAPRQAFYPHEFSPEYVREIIRPGSPARARATNYLLDTGQATSAEEAEVMLTEFFGGSRVTVGGRIFFLDPERFVGGLERGRELNLPGYIDKPWQAVELRGWKVARRFSELDHFGRADAKIGTIGGFKLKPEGHGYQPEHGLIGDLARTAGYRQGRIAAELWLNYLGRPIEETVLQEVAGKFSRAGQRVMAVTKLPLAVITNATQAAQIMLRTDLWTASRAFAKSFTASGVREAQQLGVLSEMSMRQLMEELAGSPRMSRAVDAALWPFNVVEKWDRIQGANAGRIWANKLTRMVSQTPQGRRLQWLHRELDRLAFSRDEIAERVGAGRLFDQDSARIAFAIADQTQFIARKARRSAFFNTPVGALMGQFKPFAINAGRLMQEVMLREARHGNFAPLARTLAVFPIVGEVAADLRALVAGRGRETFLDPSSPRDVGARILENFFFVGGLGLATDFVQSAIRFGPEGVLRFFAGPFLSEAATAVGHGVGGIPALADMDEVTLERRLQWWARYGVRQIPYLGPGLSEWLRTDPRALRRAEQTWTERIGLDPAEASLRRMERVGRLSRATLKRAHDLAGEGRWEAAYALVDRFNETHGTTLRLTLSTIRRRQRGITGPEAERRRRLPPGVRTLPDAVGE